MREKIVFGTAAGALIAMAAIAYLSCENAFAGSVLFAFGLLTIVNYNFQLFTGVVGYTCVQKSKKELLRYSLFSMNVWFWNLVGAMLVGYALSHTRTYAKIYPKLEALMQSKCSDSPSSLFILGIFCGILMFIAVNTYKKTEAAPIVKTVLLFACVVVFILSGYEHCVANMAYIALYQKFDMGIITILLFSTLGNIVGCNLPAIPMSMSFNTKK